MSRLNVTLDDTTLAWLGRHASRRKLTVAALARELILEAVEHREAMARRRQLAADYAAGRADARALLGELDAPQLDGLLDPA